MGLGISHARPCLRVNRKWVSVPDESIEKALGRFSLRTKENFCSPIAYTSLSVDGCFPNRETCASTLSLSLENRGASDFGRFGSAIANGWSSLQSIFQDNAFVR